MNMRLRVSMAKIRAQLGQRQSSSEVKDEIKLHVQMLKERLILQGMVPRDAKRRQGVSLGTPRC
jgi:hypothetical protein